MRTNSIFSGLFTIRGNYSPVLRYILPWIPIIALGAIYLYCAQARRAENPRDKLLPLPKDFITAWQESTTENEFTSEIPLVLDLKSSLRLFAYGYGTAIIAALCIGLCLGAFPWLTAMCDPTLRILSYLPPIALLPLIILSLGIGDLAKCSLIFIATFIPLTRNLTLRVIAIPQRQIWNAMTLGASTLEMLLLVIRRFVEPGFLDDVRLLLGTAWVYLLASELIASNAGLGYRIGVAGRNLNVAQMLLYIAIICLMAYLMDRVIYYFNCWKNRWSVA